MRKTISSSKVYFLVSQHLQISLFFLLIEYMYLDKAPGCKSGRQLMKNVIIKTRAPITLNAVYKTIHRG